MFGRIKSQSIDLNDLRFCGGSTFIVGDENIFYVCCALIVGIKALEEIPRRKRSYFQNCLLLKWKRLLAVQSGWMQKLEDFNR